MKIHLCSDLHLEFGNLYYPHVDADIIIVAGDVYVRPNEVIYYLTLLSQDYRNVIFVCGNHEYYNNDIAEVDLEIASHFRDSSDVHILQNERVVIDGVSFYGGTMWTDGYGNNDSILEDSINDFRLIKNFSVSRMRKLHEEFKRNFVQSDVVISHHVPDVAFTHPMYIGSPINGGFIARDMGDYLFTPKVWCFGHTHNYWDVSLNNTRFLCNPYGYSQNSKSFNKKLVFEV